MLSPEPITAPDSPALEQLCDELRSRADALDATPGWPREQLELCRQFGVYRWFIPVEYGGLAWDQEDVIRGYLALSQACLTTTFVLTQRTGACNRIATSDNIGLREQLLPQLARGDLFATVGISHLTTSRQHVARPVLRAYPTDDGYLLDGFSPWVTGANRADYVTVGAVVMDGQQPTSRQLLAAVPTDRQGVSAPEGTRLVALTSSQTGRFELAEVRIEDALVLAGPIENVMSQGSGGTTGGLQTSTLALGLSRAAAALLDAEAAKRPDLESPRSAIRDDCAELEEQLLAAVRGEPICSNDQLRTRANSLVLRSTQAALVAAKGAGFVAGHPAGRWCREALFFLVWSCPQPVVSANLCELAGILD